MTQETPTLRIAKLLLHSEPWLMRSALIAPGATEPSPSASTCSLHSEMGGQHLRLCLSFGTPLKNVVFPWCLFKINQQTRYPEQKDNKPAQNGDPAPNWANSLTVSCLCRWFSSAGQNHKKPIGDKNKKQDIPPSNVVASAILPVAGMSDSQKGTSENGLTWVPL